MRFGAARLRERLSGSSLPGLAQVLHDQVIGSRPLAAKAALASPAARAYSAKPDDGEGLCEEVTSLAQRAAVGGDGEEHAPVAVEAVAHDEVVNVAGGIQPGLALFNFVVELGEHPEGAALQPHGLVGVEDCPGRGPAS